MSRQDANAAFALSSFLQGTNAAYIDDLYARYEQDPAAVDPEWQEFFKSLKDPPADVQKNAEGPSWGRDNWPVTPRDDLTSALDGNWAQVEKAVGAQDRRQGTGQGRRNLRRRRHPGDARFRSRADADPRLPHARPFPRQTRSARHRGAARPRRTGSAHLWLHRSRFRPENLPRSRARARIRHLARNCCDLRAHLLPDARCRIHAHHQRGPEGLDSGAHRGTRQGNQLHPRGAPGDPATS